MPEQTQPTMHDQTTARALVESLRSKLCPACGGPKKTRQTFCRTDYFKLPIAMRKATYNPLGSGYQEAVIEAMDFLQATTFRLPPQRMEFREVPIGRQFRLDIGNKPGLGESTKTSEQGGIGGDQAMLIGADQVVWLMPEETR